MPNFQSRYFKKKASGLLFRKEYIQFFEGNIATDETHGFSAFEGEKTRDMLRITGLPSRMTVLARVSHGPSSTIFRRQSSPKKQTSHAARGRPR
jgi:hypothetical protein